MVKRTPLPYESQHNVFPYMVPNRSNFSQFQLGSMESVFNEECRPGRAVLERLSQQIELPLKNVQIWFQNRRARARKKGIVLKTNNDSLRYSMGGLNYRMNAQDKEWSKTTQSIQNNPKNLSIQTSLPPHMEVTHSQRNPGLYSPYGHSSENSPFYGRDMFNRSSSSLSFMSHPATPTSVYPCDPNPHSFFNQPSPTNPPMNFYSHEGYHQPLHGKYYPANNALPPMQSPVSTGENYPYSFTPTNYAAHDIYSGRASVRSLHDSIPNTPHQIVDVKPIISNQI